MPRLTAALVEDSMQQHKLAGNFGFSAVKIDDQLGSTHYTLATIAVDTSGSVSTFSAALKKMLIAAVDGCKKAPTNEAIMVRVVEFSGSVGIKELHGFKPVNDINLDDYQDFDPEGGTPLVDAVYSSIAATNVYAEQLRASEYSCNAILFVITDGGENASTMKMPRIKAELLAAKTNEKLESVMSILIGIGADQYVMADLKKFQTEAGMNDFVAAGDATPGKLAKIAGLISRSVSSTSQAIGTGGPSKDIDLTV